MISAIKAFKDNYIWVLPDRDQSAWVVDPGDAAPVMAEFNKQSLKLAGILLTHHHHDHSGGIADLCRAYGDIPIIGSSKSAIQEINHHVRDGDRITCAGIEIEILAIPGHTLDHIAFYSESQFLFCGDTLFHAGCGKVFEGTPAMMYDSLTKLARLDPSTKMYCGHEYTLNNLKFAQQVEPDNAEIAKKLAEVTAQRAHEQCTLPSTMAEQLAINPFLRVTHPTVAQAVSQQAGMVMTDPVEIFAYLREWKNHYR